MTTKILNKRLMDNLQLTYSIPSELKFLDTSAKDRIEKIREDKAAMNTIAQRDPSKQWVMEALTKQEKELRQYRAKLNSIRSIYSDGDDNAYTKLMEELFICGYQRKTINAIMDFISGKGATIVNVPDFPTIAAAVEREKQRRRGEHTTFISDCGQRLGHMLEEKPDGFECCCMISQLDRSVLSRT